ncbi:hypothetical protein ACGF07_14765 [Kitasatospora sp. NPDC048194]|uniref:hypothetical protein n=1 Tax=Kitasatospora sp. NPDC048194 TaxID=3364045 RepID=UPI003723BE7F
MTLLLCLGVLGAYGLGALLTTRTVFRRGREGYLAGTLGTATERTAGAFERQERQQLEALALCAGVLWVVAVPVLLARRLVTTVALARPHGPVGPAPQEVSTRIDELERALELGPYAPVRAAESRRAAAPFRSPRRAA